jgi:hypothetical protein
MEIGTVVGAAERDLTQRAMDPILTVGRLKQVAMR